MTNLRNEIEKIFEVHRLAGLSDYDFGIREEWEVIEWIDQILSLLEGSLPKEWDSEHQLGDYTTSQIDQIEKDAIGVIKYTEGWNACLQEIRSKMK